MFIAAFYIIPTSLKIASRSNMSGKGKERQFLPRVSVLKETSTNSGINFLSSKASAQTANILLECFTGPVSFWSNCC